ncbi:Transposase, partial [Candida maltosa Xu316]
RQLAEWIIEETLRNKAPRAAEIKSVAESFYYWCYGEYKSIGSNWLEGFLKRRPEIVKYKAVPIDDTRAKGANEEAIKDFFKRLVKIQEEYHFEPQDIYNFDETGMTLSRRKNEIVIGPNTEDFTNNKKGVKSLPVVGYADREGCTVIECCSAAGQRLPSYFIFKGTKPCAHWIANQDFAIESNLTSSFSADSTADQSSIPVVDESTEFAAESTEFAAESTILID